ncbi:hypothetical protein CK203_102744 [Vitis vinifera]|uniref:DUF7746 domain-containing protein n=1 Tax=Vitis vinifera TaxID=29760 RepID=A0A438C6B0_VITVI|nr:hypothetical protein CK203_102744 [Vitis vinifera]
MSRRSSDSQDTVVNSEEINYPKIQNDLDDWKLPKVSNQEIYKKGTFKFFTDYTIKTSEMTVSLEQDDQVIRLLDNRSVEKHKKDGYNFIHFGMIQVAAKPLTRLGLNTAIVMCLRDNRHLEYRDSIIGAVQAGLNDGPVYFQCYPNFTVRLRDADILDSVVLHIKTHGFKIKPGNSPVSIITRFAYKSMNTSVGSGALCTSPKGETTYFHSDMLDKSDFIIPKKILWKDVDFPENWHFANAVPAIAQRSESIEQIVQYPDGGGELVFSKSFRHSSSPRVSVYEPSRASSSSIPVRTTREEGGSSSGNPKNVKLQDESPVMSPTYSQMINTISLSDEDFEINKDLLRKDFYSEVNKQKMIGSLALSLSYSSNNENKPYEFSKDFQENPQVNQAFVDRINQKIKDNLVTPLTDQPDKRINMIKGDISSEEEADELIKMFEEPHNQIINNLETFKTRNYYPRPTFPDMQFEERNQYTQASYTSGTIYEWNIDGMTEYNILTKLQEMTMVSTAYKLNNRLPDHAVAQTIVAGINESNEVVKDEDGQDIEDAVATLIYSISKHFIGDPAKIKDKTADLLTNLKCPKLHDFSGLPKLFSERIRIKIREQYNGQIPYDKLTYGEIISIVTGEGIKLCNDFKLKQQMKNEQKIYKNEFGSFCSQFGFSQKKLCLPLSKTKTDSDNEDDINQLDSSGDVSSQSSSDQDVCIKGNCNCRPKTINVISQDQEFILDTLRKVEDEKTKQNLYEVFKKSVVKVEAKKTVNPYNLNDILNRFDQQSPKDVSIKELHEEVKQHKKEIKELRQFISLGLSDLQDQINRIGNQEIHTDIPESSHVNDNETNTFLNTVSRVIFQRWEISLTIVVKDKFVFDIIALIDSGAAENCLQESLVPIPLCEETSESLFGANGQRLAIKYKLTDVHIRNHDICIKQTFILVKNLKEKALLGIPFLSSIYPLWVDNQGFMRSWPLKRIPKLLALKNPNPVKLTNLLLPIKCFGVNKLKRKKHNFWQSFILSKPMHESSHMPNKMLTLYYDPSDHSKPIKATQYPATSGSQTFKQQYGLAFSTCHIYKILTVKQWGGNPNLSREFSEPSKPSWWTYYGPTIKILPKPILDGFELFRSSFNIPRELSAFPPLLFFFSNFGLAWIVQWTILLLQTNQQPFHLGRTFKTKWWDALKNDASTDAVKQYFLKNPSQVSASDDMSQFLLKKQQLQAMLAAAKTPQEFQKILDEGSSSFSQEILMQSLTIQQATFQTMVMTVKESFLP